MSLELGNNTCPIWPRVIERVVLSFLLFFPARRSENTSISCKLRGALIRNEEDISLPEMLLT